MGKLYDLIIIGSGSAGMTAGIYAGRSKLKTLILEKDAPGGQIKITSEVVNYPGIMLTSGEELSATMRRQAENFGVEFTKATVLSADFSGDIKKIHTTVGDYEALSVIIATGAKPRTLGFKGEAEYRGRGIGYCATCDGGFFAGKDVFVIGAGFAAAEEAIYLTRYARKVTVIAREPEFTCSKSIAEKVLAHPKIEVKFNTEIIEAGGDSVLKYARFINNKTNEEWQYDVDDKDSTFGIFIFVGYIPESAEFKDSVKTDEYGYIITDDEMRTNIDGVYAAGDVRPKILRQLVTATADGAIAATSAERYITAIKERLGIRTEDENVDVDGKGNAVASASKAEMKATQGAEQKQPQEQKAEGQHYFDDSLREQIASVLERFENTVTLAAVLDPTHETYGELVSFLTDFSSLSDKIKLKMLTKGEDEEFERRVNATIFPTIAVLAPDGTPTGVQFHGIPGGHEINSFIITLYNTAGPGQAISDDTLAKIDSIDKPVSFKVGVTLSCNMCPDVVVGTQLMAIKNTNVSAEMIDVMRFPQYRDKYSIMSVPAIVINDEKVVFGKKSIDELIELVKSE